MILPCKTGQPEWVMRNALVLTALANFRVVDYTEVILQPRSRGDRSEPSRHLDG
jgi:hypothetical protein